jgi:hypothetical protein
MDCSIANWRDCRIASATGGIGVRGIGAKVSIGLGSLEARALGASVTHTRTLTMAGGASSSAIEGSALTLSASFAGMKGDIRASCEGGSGLTCKGSALGAIGVVGIGGSCSVGTTAKASCAPSAAGADVTASSQDGVCFTADIGLFTAGWSVHPLETVIGVAGALTDAVQAVGAYLLGGRASQGVPVVGGSPVQR